MAKEKRSFFERLTGTINVDEYETEGAELAKSTKSHSHKDSKAVAPTEQAWAQEESTDGELAVDVYQTADEVIIKTMVAGVHPDDLDISITRDMVTIKGTREATHEVSDDSFFFKELYWGTFSRTILLPQEVEVEEAEASEKNGLLTIKLPKVDKGRQTKLKVKST